jgi:alpha-N-acetylglucosamine transferase
MTRLYILEQKIRTLEIIVETIVDELIQEELIDEVRFDNSIIKKIKQLNNEIQKEKELEDEKEMLSFPFFGKKGEA